MTPNTLSLPLQLFPAVRIMENGLFSKSGKHNPQVRFLLSVLNFLGLIICIEIDLGQVAEEYVPRNDRARMFPHFMGRRFQLGRICELYRLVRMVSPLAFPYR